MLAARGLRLASIRCVHPPHCAWSSSGLRALPLATQWIARPRVANYSKDAKAAEPASNLSENPISPNNSQIISESCDKATLSSSVTETVKDNKPKAEDCSTTGAVTDVGVKLPSKDQVETFFFKSLAYFWDFTYYAFCLCRKLFETYVVKNATVQSNWRHLLKRMEDARQDRKSK